MWTKSHTPKTKNQTEETLQDFFFVFPANRLFSPAGMSLKNPFQPANQPFVFLIFCESPEGEKTAIFGPFGVEHPIAERNFRFSPEPIFSPSWNEFGEALPVCERALDILDFL